MKGEWRCLQDTTVSQVTYKTAIHENMKALHYNQQSNKTNAVPQLSGGKIIDVLCWVAIETGKIVLDHSFVGKALHSSIL